ncbi:MULTISPECIES: hypothetical protein [Jeotgalicoccus]|uniref:hypothetical protein n=1 Tax=Jeotgalicoccus TaxID=227979 RepID=UPI000409C800|nr:MULTISPECIES: hypothetical protein [Jeotgalicoccus]QQD85472.1 hypothetical protein JEM45_02265 [Jeotgalicoccus sp. ATCC 8456]
MKNDGFLLFDSILSLVIFSTLLMLIPAILHIQKIDDDSQNQVEFYRHLYIKSLLMEEDEFINYAKNEHKINEIKCKEKLSDLCP